MLLHGRKLMLDEGCVAALGRGQQDQGRVRQGCIETHDSILRKSDLLLNKSSLLQMVQNMPTPYCAPGRQQGVRLAVREHSEIALSEECGCATLDR